MTNLGAYPPSQAGQGNQSAVIVAMPGEPLAEAIASELRQLGWRAAVTEQVGPYAREAGVCVAPLTPTSFNRPAIAAALATPVAPIIPLIVGSTPLPPGPWATRPVIFSGDPARAARDIINAANNLASAPSTYPAMRPPASSPMPMGGYGTPAAPSMYPPYPPEGATIPSYNTPAAPSRPFQPYQAAPSYPTQQGYPQYPQDGAPPYAPLAAPPKRRRWPLILGGVVVVALLLCVGGGALAYANLHGFAGAVSTGIIQTETARASTPEATVTPTIPANFTVYSDSTDGYSIAYPNSWRKTGGSGTAIFLATNEVADMALGSTDGSIPQSEINSTESQFFKSAAGSGTYSNLQGPTTATYAGESWTRESADVTTAGQTLHAVVLVANHGTHAYIIGYAGAKPSFATLDAQDFQPMLNSFTFLS